MSIITFRFPVIVGEKKRFSHRFAQINSDDKEDKTIFKLKSGILSCVYPCPSVAKNIILTLNKPYLYLRHFYLKVLEMPLPSKRLYSELTTA
ncbi:hypothetical protein BH20ACI4_BH20ACI4_29820 [soil metagenome]